MIDAQVRESERKMKTLRTLSIALLAVVILSSSSMAQGWGNLKFKFTYGGDYTAPPKIAVTRDAAVCGKLGLIDESLVVNPENKGISNVIVFYRDRTPAKIHPSYNDSVEASVVVDNIKCRFEPRVAAVWTKCKIDFKNSDPVGHNVKVDTFFNPVINPILPAGAKISQSYSMEERLPTKISCSIHPWMTGWIVVRNDPYIGVSDKDGNLEIKNLPAGEFEFQIWQEKAGYIQQVTQDGSTVEWARGRVKIKIEDGKTTDFGTIVIGADQFK